MPRPRSTRWPLFPFCLATLLGLLPESGFAQEDRIDLSPALGGRTLSMGLPPAWRFSLGANTGVYGGGEERQVQFQFNASVYRDILPPVMSALGILTEGYVSRRGDFERAGEGFDGGLRASLYSPAARLAVGYDYSFGDETGDVILSVVHPLQRGGIFTNGGSLRFDWLPGRGHTTSIGVQLPVGQRWVGRSRARNDYVRLPKYRPGPVSYEPSTQLEEASASLRDLGLWLDRLTVPFTDHWDGNQERAMEMFVGELDAIRTRLSEDAAPYYEGPRTAIGDTRAFHDELDRAFSLAVSGPSYEVGRSSELGRRVAQQARTAMLDHVLLPYDRLLGQKRREDTTVGLSVSAAASFYEWLTGEPSVSAEGVDAAVWVFRSYSRLVEEIRVRSRDRWDEERFVWLPLQLALRPEDHDEQHELNRLIERMTGDEFRRGNRIWYVENEQWQFELGRMIREARDYHVVWLHDFRGLDDNGDPDELSFKQVTEAYLPALIDAVRRYDEAGKIPQYIQLFDQYYYTANKGELWGELLQNPLRHEVRLPDGWTQWEDSIASLQIQLRSAVAESQLLQARIQLFGQDWLHDLVKVHLNVTQPPDPSYWTNELFPFFMGLPDTPVRDHRKLALYDVSEADPYKGQGIYTGMGVGEHYIGAGWEDRALLVEGPAVLDLRDAARQLLLNQGFEEHEIPWELRPKPFAENYQARVDSVSQTSSGANLVMDVHNEVGFRPKGVTVMKALLYTLMGPGAVIKAPDSIWGSNVWGSMMLGHALRGGRSLVIAPAIDNAPSAGWPQMSRAQEALTRLVVAGDVLAEQLEPIGGLIKVGLYSTGLDAGDIPGKIGELLATFEATPWLAELYGLRPEVVAELERRRSALLDAGFERRYIVSQERTTAKLHLKAHIYLSQDAWEGVVGASGIERFLSAHFDEMAALNLAMAQGVYRNYRLYSERLVPTAREVFGSVIQEGSRPGNKHILYLAVGSHNQNSRSLALDGEVAVLAEKWHALAGLPDFMTVAGLSTWVNSVDELEELFPRYEGLKRRISRWIRIVV